MNYASRDVTYCVNEKCKDRCWRHVSNYRFADDYYWYMAGCDNIKLKLKKAEKNKLTEDKNVLEEEQI